MAGNNVINAVFMSRNLNVIDDSEMALSDMITGLRHHESSRYIKETPRKNALFI